MSEEQNRMKVSTVLRAMPTLMRGSPLAVLWRFTGGAIIDDIRGEIRARRTLKEMGVYRSQRSKTPAPK